MSDDTGELGWLSISALAHFKGVDKAAISRRVARLEGQGLLKTRQGKGGTKLVNLAEFDRACGETVDLIREQNGRGGSPAAVATPGPQSPDDPVLAREQARRASYDADLKKLDLDERLRRVISVDQVRDAMAKCGQAVGRLIDQMPTRAEEIAAAVARDGVQGARAILKTMARAQRDELARALDRLGDADDEDAPPIAADVEAEAATA